MADTSIAIVPATVNLYAQYLAPVENLTAQRGLGIYNWRGSIYTIWVEAGTSVAQLYQDGTQVSTVDMDVSYGSYTFDSLLGTGPKLFMQNGRYAYTWDGVTFTYIEPETYFQVFGDYNEGDTQIGITPTAISGPVNANWIGYSVYGPSVPEDSYITEIVSPTQFRINNPLPVSVAAGDADPLEITKNGFPLATTKGSAYLNGTLYVMRRDQAALRGSEFNDPTVWKASNSILAQVETDQGMRVAKQLVYVVAFGEWSTEIFYDAGNAYGSPLAPVQGAKINVGSRHQDSHAEMEGALYWAGKTRNGSLSIYRMEGLKAQIISTPQVERLLEEGDWESRVYAWTAICAGHKYYALTLTGSNLTLVYDHLTGHWAQWTHGGDNYFPFVGSTYSNDNTPLLQHETDGKVYEMSQNYFTDAGVLIRFELVTPNFDMGTHMKKYVHTLDIIADQTEGSYLDIRCSDDDYQTWTNFRRVDLALKRPRLTNCGTFRRRAYHFRHEKQVPLRILAVEMQADAGTL